VIDCVHFDEMLSFWQGALRFVPRESPSGEWAVLKNPDGRSPNISLNKVEPSEKLTGRNWIHLDLYTDEQQNEIERLLMLGATRHAQEYEPDDDFVVLEDPDGNLFCVVDKSER
jgi:hypothetical protein